MDLVVDASALVVALLGRSTAAASVRARLVTDTSHAPHLVDAEIGNVLRRRTLAGKLDPGDAEAFLLAGHSLIDHRYETTASLARAAWSLRQNVTFYDGLYTALAAALAVPLVTADARLAQAPGLGCPVEVVGA